MRADLFDPRLPLRFWNKVIPEPNGGCWLWIGCLQSADYGQMNVDNQRVYTHRLAYETLVAPIPEGLFIDHLCRVPPCCNPAHLEPVTPQTNTARGLGAAGTHCPRGHAYQGNEYIRPDTGRRQCHECCLLRADSRNKMLTEERSRAGLCLACGGVIEDAAFKRCALCRVRGAVRQQRVRDRMRAG